MIRKLFVRIGLVALIGMALISSPSVLAPRVRAQAQDNSLIVLNDAAPTAQVIVTLNNGAPGVVYVELQQAKLTLKDATGLDILTIADKRITGIGIQLVQGVATQTLSLERLPGVTQAQARIVAQAELPPVINVTPSDVEVKALVNLTYARMAVAPAAVMPIIASPTANQITAQFPAQDQSVRLLDGTGVPLLIATTGKAISGLSMRVEPGQYVMNTQNQDATSKADVVVALSPAPTTTLLAMLPTVVPAAAEAVTCQATITTASANLRSGPGTAYSILGYSRRNAVLPVGGTNVEGGWLLVQNETSSAWVSSSIVQLSGNCNSLTAYNIPLRDAVASQPVIIRQPSGDGQTGQPSVSTNRGGEDRDDDRGGEDRDEKGDD